MRKALAKLADQAAGAGRIRGKRVKTIKGVADPFHRLRVGDYRAMYEVIPAERVILVQSIVRRSDFERWLRNR